MSCELWASPQGHWVTNCGKLIGLFRVVCEGSSQIWNTLKLWIYFIFCCGLLYASPRFWHIKEHQALSAICIILVLCLPTALEILYAYMFYFYAKYMQRETPWAALATVTTAGLPVRGCTAHTYTCIYLCQLTVTEPKMPGFICDLHLFFVYFARLARTLLLLCCCCDYLSLPKNTSN